jgi:hypothetical protein
MVKVSTECKECSKYFSSLELLHKHLRTHKVNQPTYYQRHYPRYDKFDGNLILFKSRDHYLNTDFNSRANLAAWVRKVSPEVCTEYIKDFLVARKERKGLVYAPCQVELRTLMIPGMHFIEGLVGDYAGFVKALGFKVKFDKLGFDGRWRVFGKEHKIFTDTREQMPLKFTLPTIPEALPFGDYKLNDDDFTQNCYIERKAVGDLYGTVTNGYERFCRELERAKEAKAYMVILVEGSLDMVRAYPSQTGGWVHISPEYVYHQIRKMIQEYPHIQFLFVQNREQASRAIERIFCSDGQYRHIDLQYAYDMGALC